jgi:hypothetical protein
MLLFLPQILHEPGALRWWESGTHGITLSVAQSNLKWSCRCSNRLLVHVNWVKGTRDKCSHSSLMSALNCTMSVYPLHNHHHHRIREKRDDDRTPFATRLWYFRNARGYGSRCTFQYQGHSQGQVRLAPSRWPHVDWLTVPNPTFSPWLRRILSFLCGT